MKRERRIRLELVFIVRANDTKRSRLLDRIVDHLFDIFTAAFGADTIQELSVEEVKEQS